MAESIDLPEDPTRASTDSPDFLEDVVIVALSNPSGVQMRPLRGEGASQAVELPLSHEGYWHISVNAARRRMVAFDTESLWFVLWDLDFPRATRLGEFQVSAGGDEGITIRRVDKDAQRARAGQR